MVVDMNKHDCVIYGIVISSWLTFLIFIIASQFIVDKTNGYFYFVIFILLNIYFQLALDK